MGVLGIINELTLRLERLDFSSHHWNLIAISGKMESPLWMQQTIGTEALFIYRLCEIRLVNRKRQARERKENNRNETKKKSVRSNK